MAKLSDAQARVLVIDDEVPLASVVASYISREGFDVAMAHTGPDGVSKAREIAPVLIVLDIMLPGFDGIEVCRQVRQFSDAYIIMLTAKEDEMDKVLGLSMGADDYLVKPFSPRELIARVRAMLRRPRTAATAPEAYVAGDLTVDVESRNVTVAGEPVDLTRTEFDLLAVLMSRPGVVLSRRQLIASVWGDGWYGDDHVVDVHIAHVREKIGDQAGEPKYIRTVRGVGYALVAS